MDCEKLLAYFETSPAVRLLRSPNAPFVIDFLNSTFKKEGRIAVPHSDLLAALRAYRDEVAELHPDRLPAAPEAYLSDWCSPETLWLRRFVESQHNEPLYQLTPSTEDVLLFLRSVLDAEVQFVGTESRLRLVIDTLSDIAIGSSEDPQNRLVHLRRERDELEAEITRIERSGQVAKYQPAQIRERFSTAVMLLRQLQGDFRGVEETFREIAAQVQRRQSEQRDSRGGILQFALDAEDILKREDQGVSFFEFVRLILSPSQTEKLEQIIQEIRRIPELALHHEGMDTVRNMTPLLQAEADKVMRTSQRLSAVLRRLLDTRTHAERQRTTAILGDIKRLAASLANDPPGDFGFDLELDIHIDSVWRRTFWAPPTNFAAIDLTERTVDVAARRRAFEELAALPQLDWKGLRQNIDRSVRACGSLSLPELLERCPPRSGTVDILAYLQIACDDGHFIDADVLDEVVLHVVQPTSCSLWVAVPRVIFSPLREHSHEK